jgi:hypothetical protein
MPPADAPVGFIGCCCCCCCEGGAEDIIIVKMCGKGDERDDDEREAVISVLANGKTKKIGLANTAFLASAIHRLPFRSLFYDVSLLKLDTSQLVRYLQVRAFLGYAYHASTE